MNTRELEKDLKRTALKDIAEINQGELKFLEEELARFRAWLILNQGEFTQEQKANALHQAQELVLELSTHDNATQ